MKKILITILISLATLVTISTLTIEASGNYDLYALDGYEDFDGPGTEDGKEPSLNYIPMDGNLYFNFIIPTYLIGGDQYYSTFVTNITTTPSFYTVFMTTTFDSTRLHPKIYHGVNVNKDYDYLIVNFNDLNDDSDVEMIPTADIQRIEFFEDESYFNIVIRNNDGSIFKTFRASLFKQVQIYYSNSTQVHNYEDLPLTNDEKYPASIIELEDGYQIVTEINGVLYEINVDNLPIWLVQSKEVYYTTDSSQNRLFFGFYDGKYPFYDSGSFDSNLLSNSYIAYNVFTGVYQRSEYDIVHAMLHTLGNTFTSSNQLYADIVIPHDIDTLSAITVSYAYKYKYLNGSTSNNWTQVNQQILLEGQTSYRTLPWYVDVLRWTTPITKNWKRYHVNEIEEITNVSSDYKQDYIYWLKENGSGTYNITEIFVPQSRVYQLYLGQFDKFWSVGVFTKEFAVINYRYLFDGVEYSNPFPLTEAPDMPEPPSPSDWFWELIDKLWSFFLKYSWIIIVILGIFTAKIPLKAVQVFTGKKYVKHRFWIVIGWIALLVGAWYLIMAGLT
ncbi:MAG: hypothetical protein QXI16_01035 [Sulfolobaceae archaeon]